MLHNLIVEIKFNNFFRFTVERAKQQVNVTGADVNRESVTLVPMPMGLMENDFRTMNLEVDNVMTKIKADVSLYDLLLLKNSYYYIG